MSEDQPLTEEELHIIDASAVRDDDLDEYEDGDCGGGAWWGPRTPVDGDVL